MIPGSFFSTQQFLDFRNDDATTCPTFGVMRITGVVVVSADELTVVTAAQPNTFGCQSNCFINGPVNVASGAYGLCTRSNVILALYDSADGTPAYGDTWGPQNGTWKLKKNTGGFFCLGPPTNTTQFLALFSPLPMTTFLGKTTLGAIVKGASGTINIYTGALGGETDSGITMANVYNRMNDVASAKWVRCGWDWWNLKWEIIDREC